MTEGATEAMDKSTWGPGPWQDEPDRVEWRHAGLPCLIRRGDAHGNLCGYVAVPPGHPWHGKGGSSDELAEVDVHGGLTYADACRGDICHVPQPGEPDDVWWLGFDCGHSMDFSPGLAAILRTLPGRGDKPTSVRAALFGETYKDIEYVRTQVEALALQVKAAAP